ncbi:sugar ABC transporter permease [Paenibacillus sp. FSL M7-1455]|jgi:ABC-type sugar transport system permease subunit|uniref:Lactose ABC transporter permease n=1 Tax=Paenibacillus cookii TaxID=157839 RepID=A0ABQ4LYJ8_9BACL|nr:sugar ABC transporter permease [Paenibacillus cookii]KHF32831.1 Lactose transport system permease protein LacF [Paenibacillus sp. P1XP2]GIO68360.1 lactose ABC transporter permease [Paenibacillus cookii]
MFRKSLTLSQKKQLYGLLFVTPLILGLVILFLLPLIQSFRFSLSTIRLVEGGFAVDYKGWSNYGSLFTTNPDYPRKLTESVVNMVVNVPIIIIFSLFAAVLLNQKFRGRALARAIFFLPVILASAAIANLDISSFVGGSTLSGSSGESGGGMLQSFELKKMLTESGLAPVFVDYITGAVDRIYEIISSSGVQILIFLAGLQSISPALYEASRIEGATGYEIFWKVTFPMMTPLILTNTVYSIIDSFSRNSINSLISETAFKSFEFGQSAAMSWVYFAVVTAILGISTAIISRKVFYYD